MIQVRSKKHIILFTRIEINNLTLKSVTHISGELRFKNLGDNKLRLRKNRKDSVKLNITLSILEY